MAETPSRRWRPSAIRSVSYGRLIKDSEGLLSGVTVRHVCWQLNEHACQRVDRRQRSNKSYASSEICVYVCVCIFIVQGSCNSCVGSFEWASVMAGGKYCNWDSTGTVGGQYEQKYGNISIANIKKH